MRGVIARVRCQFRRRDRTNFESVKDREVDHGEEEESEETVHQKEGCSGPQATEGNESGEEAVDQEKVGPQGCAQASLGAATRSRSRRTGAGAVLEPTERLWRRWRYRRLVSMH
jgi:hypothetical protein